MKKYVRQRVIRNNRLLKIISVRIGKERSDGHVIQI